MAERIPLSLAQWGVARRIALALVGVVLIWLAIGAVL
jgi:hypothetical protein